MKKPLTVMVIGSGAREHALAWKLALSPRVSEVIVSPGNGGTGVTHKCRNIVANDIDSWLAIAKEERVDLTIVGPEAPLAAGIVDRFQKEGLTIFGPTQAAAQLEASKAFAKLFMSRHRIPTARYAIFTDPEKAHAYIDSESAPIVVKASGLASGKGVIVAKTIDEAHAAVDRLLVERSMGEAGNQVIIEEYLSGEEASFIVVSNGRDAIALATSQDHKRLLDNDQGPNTGGMGAYSPTPLVTPEIHARIMREIIYPTLEGMAAEGTPYVGFLYVGLMITPEGRPYVLEYNCRLGDPETQSILVRLKSDLIDLVEAALTGRITDLELQWDRRAAISVVLAAEGYPNTPRQGDPIVGLPASPILAEDSLFAFHGGTYRTDEGTFITAGGRILTVTALGETLRTARDKVYYIIDKINFKGKQFRRDIGKRALNQR